MNAYQSHINNQPVNTTETQVTGNPLADNKNPVQHLLYWESIKGNAVYMTQPLLDGDVVQLTWSQVADQARRVAAYIQSLHLPERSNIILIGKNSAHWIIADLAIWMAGHVTVPIYPTLGAETAGYIFDHCEAKILIVGKLDGRSDSWNEVGPVFPPSLPKIILPMAPLTAGAQWSDIIADYEPLPLAEIDQRGYNELATIVYTSGTTGKPKGVMHSFRSLIAPCLCTQNLWCPSQRDRMLSYLPLAHIAERVAVEIPSLVFGFQIFFNDSLETFATDLKRARPTRFFSVPRLWTKFYQSVNANISPAKQKLLFALPVISRRIKHKILLQLGLDHARIGLTGAAPLPANIVAWYRKLGLELLEVFGMSENSATSHSARIGEVRPGYVGTPLPGVECRIDDSGEVLVKSPGQMLGYYKMPEETAAQFTDDGFFHTGDRGELDKKGRLKITGRVKDLFKTSKGKYVAPVPIENKLGAHPAIEIVCVTGPGQPQPFALALLSPEMVSQEMLSPDIATNATADREALTQDFENFLAKINASLEDHEKLEYMVVVNEPWTIESGLLTPTMKLRRDMIEQNYLSRADNWRAMGKKIIWD